MAKILNYKGCQVIAPGSTFTVEFDSELKKELIELQNGKRIWRNSAVHITPEKGGYTYAFTNTNQVLTGRDLLVNTEVKEID